MNFISGLSCIVFTAFLANTGVAVAAVAEQVSNPVSSDQAEPFVMANIFIDIQRAVQTIDRVNQIRLQEQRRREEERRREELEAARREATEQQRLEAEQRRQYFESLPPEEKEAYLAEQRALQAQQADAASSLLLLMLGAFSEGSGSTQQDSERDVWCAADDGGFYPVRVPAGEPLPNATCG
ncbi:MAG: hypothetical protein HC824_00840 [Synechococcales cyanobacterium RM1_1_8]|nr:hypothetical protein [Synechococcales cyanobacterium RM1_1_8]